MRGGTPCDTFAEARIERLGKRMANVESYAWQGDRDRPIASARINFLLDRG
jgi:acyl-coenzyme A thioesterase PaaI-like protein